MVRFLLAHGAKVNVKDKEGETPLRYAMRLGALAGWDRREIVELLRQQGGHE